MASQLDFLPYQQKQPPPAPSLASANAPPGALPPPVPRAPSAASPPPNGDPYWGYVPPPPPPGYLTDPGYVNAVNQRDASVAQAKAWLQQQRQQSLFRFNGANNPFSLMALLNQTDSDNKRKIIDGLAARGIVRSGEYGFQNGQEAKWYGLQAYNANNNLLDQMNQWQQQYLQAVNAANAPVSQALIDWNNNNPNGTPLPPPINPYNPGPGGGGGGRGGV